MVGPLDSHEITKKRLAKTCGCRQERLTHILMDHDLHPNPQGGAVGRKVGKFLVLIISGEIECIMAGQPTPPNVPLPPQEIRPY